jgi:hypothetical protein
LVNFARRLTSSDFTAFWYSCKLIILTSTIIY